jgi:UDP-N-acetylglucosamine acyltransferase
MAAIAPTVVHATAVVDRDAKLGQGVVVGPYCVVGPECRIGDNTRLDSHVVVVGFTEIGEGGHLHPFAVLGGAPQDLKYRDERTDLILGDSVVVREHATVHRGTAAGRGRTTVDDGTLLMAYAHVAHDCEVGAGVVMANGATLAGHVTVEDGAVLGGYAAIGQYLRVGETAMVAAGAMVEQDVPPYCTVAGDRARVRALNTVGLRRRGIEDDDLSSLRAAFRHLFRGRQPMAQALDAVRGEVTATREVAHLVDFVASSRKGVCR